LSLLICSSMVFSMLTVNLLNSPNPPDRNSVKDHTLCDVCIIIGEPMLKAKSQLILLKSSLT
jgi:hypothetical protein